MRRRELLVRFDRAWGRGFYSSAVGARRLERAQAALPLAFTISGTSYTLQNGHACDYDGTNVYVTSNDDDLDTHLAIVRVNPANFTAVADGALLAVCANNRLTNVFCFTADYVWCGSEATGSVVCFDKAALGTQTVVNTSGSGGCWCVYNDGTDLWTCHNNSTGALKRIDPATLAVFPLFFAPAGGLGYVNKILYHAATGQYCFCAYQAPGKIGASSHGAAVDALVERGTTETG